MMTRCKPFHWGINWRSAGLLAGLSGMMIGCATPPPDPIASLTPDRLSAVQPASFNLTSNDAELTFAVRSIALGRVAGTFPDFTATLNLEQPERGRASLSAVVQTAAAAVERPGLTDLIRSPAWFDVDQFPEATFEGAMMSWSADGTGTLRGSMTVRGVTKDEEISFRLSCAGVTVPCPGQAVSFEATLSIDRSDYGMTALPGLVNNEVTMMIAGELPLFSE